MNALISQAVARTYVHAQKGTFKSVSPWGRIIDMLVFVRSYQETEKGLYEGVEEALTNTDRGWRDRELIIMPSHASDISNERRAIDDLDQMIEAAHGAGFDIVCATILFADQNGAYEVKKPQALSTIWKKNWDERWTVPNKHFANASADDPSLTGQLESLGRDLWTWICQALAS